MMKIEKSLDFAMETEEKGIRFYKKALKSTKNKDAKVLFSLLLDQEERHKKVLKSLYGDDSGKKVIKAKNDLEELKMDNPMFEGEEIHDKSLMEIFNEAMNFEREGHNLYRDISNKIQESEGKEFFEELSRQEKNHLEKIKNLGKKMLI